MKTTKQRLSHYRAMAVKYPTSGGWKHWYHKNTFGEPNNARSADGSICSDSIEQYGEEVTFAGRGLDHTGWYADSYQNSLIKPHVTRLRCSKGTLYVPVTHCTDWDGTRHYMQYATLIPKGSNEDEHEQAALDALHIADRCAEIESEESREAFAKDQAEQDILAAREEIHAINKQVLPLIHDAKRQKNLFTGPICEAIKYQIESFLKSRNEQFRTIDNRQSDFWTAVSEH